MPLSCDPNETTPFVLKTDQNKPEPRPQFDCRFISKCDRTRHARLVTEAEGIKDETIWDVLWNAIAIVVVGWKAISDEPFSREAMEAKLTETEIMELALGCADAVKMAEDDRKNLSSPRSSTPGSAAEVNGASGLTESGSATAAPQ